MTARGPARSGPADDVRVAVAAAARRLAAEGLLVGTAGNVSARVPTAVAADDDSGASGSGGGLVAVTGTGVVLAECAPDDVTLVDAAGEVVAGRLVPTSELGLHLGVLADRPDAGAVVHTHAPFSTAVACVLPELPVLHYQQLGLGGVVRVAPYATFGSAALADGVRTALVDRQAALMGNHGSIAVGRDLAQAVEHALLLEWLCTLHHRARALGTPRILTDDEQTDVVLAALSRGYGRPQEIV